ncbi:DUF4298 domain-containing protein [Aerococcaceae bacterium zg-ZJ1578]|uniref:DUF4298 domain-containing protein n=1 Tax=Aerococcaceae bacterium zg-252 TaxID=2796928 RepID=UPI001A2B12C0|nr:DUF4298 domain-containing protein [Aerococcaceae bacterium zg-1578]MBR7926900.1 DUF4298 domain-containing protein [Aerococcaceae bacterium zg-ZUI334]
MKADVIQFEKILNESQALYDQLEDLLEKIADNEAQMLALREYYYSEEYHRDVEISNQTDEYKGIAHGVLSEDAVYNLMIASYQNSIRMLEVATQTLKHE